MEIEIIINCKEFKFVKMMDTRDVYVLNFIGFVVDCVIGYDCDFRWGWKGRSFVKLGSYIFFWFFILNRVNY